MSTFEGSMFLILQSIMEMSAESNQMARSLKSCNRREERYLYKRSMACRFLRSQTIAYLKARIDLKSRAMVHKRRSGNAKVGWKKDVHGVSGDDANCTGLNELDDGIQAPHIGPRRIELQ